MLNDDDVIWSDFHLFICRDKMLSNAMVISYNSMKTANMQHTIMADTSLWDHTRVTVRGSGGQPLKHLLNLPLSLLFQVTCK